MHLVHLVVEPGKDQLAVALHNWQGGVQNILRHTKSLLGVPLDVDCVAILRDLHSLDELGGARAVFLGAVISPLWL